MIEIIQPGILSSVQDLGREGFRSLGVGVSGAMDRLALRVANTLVGNPDTAAGIETTFGGFLCQFTADCPFAVTGAVAEFFLDDLPIPAWTLIVARAGQVLEVGAPSIGMRSYIACAGGIDVPVVMGSRSTDLKGDFGGYCGRALRQGDVLTLMPFAGGCLQAEEFGVSTAAAGIGLEEELTTVRMIPAAEWGDYSPAMQAQFLDTHWCLDQISNRVGYRLIGPALTSKVRKELLSHGILPGTIQLPPSGQPVVQMADANTCGGYPKLGVVIEADLSKLGQVQLGKKIRFVCVSPEQAIQAMEADRSLISAIRGLAALALNTTSASNPARNVFVDAGVAVVTSPARGILRWNHPDQSDLAPLPEVGSPVEQNQLLCYLNAGHLYWPIRAPVSGVILDLPAESRREIGAGDAILSLRMN